MSKTSIQLLGLTAFRDKFIGELSTGTRRMVEIASLLPNAPTVIILDEPSSGIAQKETEALGPMLKEVQRYLSCSILIIEHDMPLITGLADHIVALELGSVIAHGRPARCSRTLGSSSPTWATPPTRNCKPRTRPGFRLPAVRL